MEIWILDDTLRISIYFERDDSGFEDNICVSIYESCPENEKILFADETNIYLTPEQASRLVEALKVAVEKAKNDEGRRGSRLRRSQSGNGTRMNAERADD